MIQRMYNSDVYHIFANYNGSRRHYVVTLDKIGNNADGETIYRATMIYISGANYDQPDLAHTDAVVYLFTTSETDGLENSKKVVNHFHEELRSRYVEIHSID